MARAALLLALAATTASPHPATRPPPAAVTWVSGPVAPNDTVLLWGTGQARSELGEGLEEVAVHLARAIARDGEGASRLVTVRVEGAPDEAGAAQVARTIATHRCHGWRPVRQAYRSSTAHSTVTLSVGQQQPAALAASCLARAAREFEPRARARTAVHSVIYIYTQVPGTSTTIT